jgi:4-diphosphocytidyl-2-C-methyl-D-erythritol kinase
MIVFPNCKLNLGLNIVSKRNDGYHNLETVFLPININDALEIIIQRNANSPIEFTSSGLLIDGNEKDNLCIKAYYLLKRDFDLLPIKMHLHKTIPMGAGLGGGSANAAFTLLLLNELFELDIPQSKLIQYALLLGSDCPFFIINKPCFATSRGEVLQPISLNLSAYKILIVNPGIHISTAQAFSKIDITAPENSIRDIINKPIRSWKNNLVNDFEQSVFKQFDGLEELKNKLYEAGAIYASMTGTGSTFFGIFKLDESIDTSSFEHYNLCKWVDTTL